MPIAFLIDGYNLLHAVGLAPRMAGPGGLQWARRRLLELLTAGFPADAGEVVIVFDAHRAPRRGKAEFDYAGLHIRFAVGEPEADDLIEHLIAEHPTPKTLTVVSNDHRLQTAARRKAARAWTCDDLPDHFEALKRQGPAAPPADEKQDKITRAEMEGWVAEFKDLADDPGFKELFDPYPFDEDEFKE